MAGKSRKVSKSVARRYAKTRKGSKGSKKAPCQNMGLPEIRRGLQYIESYAHTALAKTDNIREAAADYAREWYEVFNKKLDLADAEEYLKHAGEFAFGTKAHKSKGKKQTGGEAPVDYQLRVGTVPPYGTFLPYVANGFGIGIPEMSSRDLCAAGGTPAVMPYPDTGSNLMKGGAKGASSRKKGAKNASSRKQQHGAGLFDTLSQVFTHPPPSNPTGVLTDAVAAARGQPLPPGGASTVRAWNYEAGSAAQLKSVLQAGQATAIGQRSST